MQTQKEVKLADQLFSLYVDVLGTLSDWKNVLWSDVTKQIGKILPGGVHCNISEVYLSPIFLSINQYLVMIYTIIFNFYFQFHRWYEWEDRDFFHALQEASCQTSRVQCLQNSESSNWRFSSCPANSAGIYEGDQSIIICFFFWIILLIEMRWMQMRWMRWRALESGMDHILWSAVNLVDFKRGTWWVDIGYSWALEVDMCGLIKSGLKHKYQLLLIHINYQVPFQTSCVRCCRILPVFLSFALLLYIHHSY